MPKFVHDIKFTTPKIKHFAFSASIGDKNILYQVLKMKDSLFIFINERNNLNLDDLSLAMNSNYDRCPIATQLFGNFSTETSKSIAARTCKKLNKCVYFSCNIEFDKITFPYIEKCLYDQIKKYPERF